jgi:ATP-dependent Zn protease
MSFTETNSRKNANSQLLTKGLKPLTLDGFTFTTRLGSNSTFLSDEEIKHEILVLLAGQAALKLITRSSYSEYMKEHNAVCLNMIKKSLSKGEENSDAIVKEALRLKEQYLEEALELLAPYKEAIERLAATLIEKEIIRAEEWEELIKEIFSTLAEEAQVAVA